MPSDFISLLSADLDLESPKSLYSRGESGWGWGVGAGEGGGEGERREAPGVPFGAGAAAGAAEPGTSGVWLGSGNGDGVAGMVEGQAEEWRPLPRGAAEVGGLWGAPRFPGSPRVSAAPRARRPRHSPPGLPRFGESP
jgi:hypothetical protein